jgi:hypothetical protein
MCWGYIKFLKEIFTPLHVYSNCVSKGLISLSYGRRRILLLFAVDVTAPLIAIIDLLIDLL